MIGSKKVDDEHIWITNGQPLEKWIWQNGLIHSSGSTTHLLAQFDYKAYYGFNNHNGKHGVICEWPKWDTMV